MGTYYIIHVLYKYLQIKDAKQCITIILFWNYKNLSKSTMGLLLPCQYLWNDLSGSVVDGVGLAWFQNILGQCLFIAKNKLG